MELEFETRALDFWEPVAQECLPEEQTAELIVPDSFPDMARIVDCWAEVLLRSKECRTGSASVSGSVQAGLLFLAEGEEEPRKLECELPFSVRLERPELTQESFVCFSGRVRSVDARMLNSRKAMIRVNLLSELGAWQPRQQQAPLLREKPEELELLEQAWPVSCVFAASERAFVLQEEVELPAGQSAVRQLLSWSAQPAVQEVKPLGHRIAFRGEIHLQLFYLGETNTLERWSGSLPFTQYVELTEDLEDAAAELTLCATGRSLEQNDTGRHLYLTLNLLAQCRVSRVETLQLVQDLYSTARESRPVCGAMQLQTCLDSRTVQATALGSIEAAAGRIESARVFADQPLLERQGTGLQITLPLLAQLLVRDESAALQPLSGRLSAVISLEAAENCTVQVCVQPQELYAAPSGGGVELRCPVDVQVYTWAKQELPYVSAVELSEPKDEPDRPSVVLLYPKPDERLWEIAKRFRTTVSALRAVNGLGEAEEPQGRTLIIPLGSVRHTGKAPEHA